MKTISKFGGVRNVQKKTDFRVRRGADPWDWYIYLHLVDYYMVNVGNYTIHGCYVFFT